MAVMVTVKLLLIKQPLEHTTMTTDSSKNVSTDVDNQSDINLDPKVHSGLTERMITLDTVAPETEIEDPETLREVFAGRRIVGLGEATHGAREISQLKQRLLRFLIDDLDFRLFGLEANFTQTLSIDRYVRRGKGDSFEALGNLYSWPWISEDMLSLIEWLRRFNTGRSPEDQVRFYGLDVQHTKGVADAVADYLDRVDPEYLATVREDLAVLADPGLHLPETAGRDERLAAGNRVVPDLRATFEERRANYIDRSSERSWELVRQQVTVLEQALELGMKAHTGEELINEEVIRFRDRAMAENVAWILEHESADRIAVWAHNDHVNKMKTTAGCHSAASMGRHLTKWYNEEYYSLGFEFGRGDFQAYVETKKEDWVYEVKKCNLNNPLPNTVAFVFNALPCRIGFLDFRTALDDSRLVEWLNGEQRLHSIGTAYDRENPEKHVKSYVLAEAFDGLCYVDEISRTCLLHDD